MKLLRGRAGSTLIELTVVLAITGLIAGPLVSVMGAQLRLPAKISREVVAKQQELKSTLVIADDTSLAQSFVSCRVPDDGTIAPCRAPEYGTFFWHEFSADTPVPTSSRYFFNEGSVLRVVKRGVQESAPQLVVTGIDSYADVTFQHIAPKWSFDSIKKTWTYTEGKIEVSIVRTQRTEEGEATTTKEELVADFRPQLTRPVVRPSASGGAPLQDHH